MTKKQNGAGTSVSVPIPYSASLALRCPQVMLLRSSALYTHKFITIQL